MCVCVCVWVGVCVWVFLCECVIQTTVMEKTNQNTAVCVCVCVCGVVVEVWVVGWWSSGLRLMCLQGLSVCSPRLSPQNPGRYWRSLQGIAGYWCWPVKPHKMFAARKLQITLAGTGYSHPHYYTGCSKNPNSLTSCLQSDCTSERHFSVHFRSFQCVI